MLPVRVSILWWQMKQVLAGKGETKNVSEEFFIKCRETPQPFISDVTIDENDRPIITVAVPYIEDDDLRRSLFDPEC